MLQQHEAYQSVGLLMTAADASLPVKVGMGRLTWLQGCPPGLNSCVRSQDTAAPRRHQGLAGVPSLKPASSRCSHGKLPGIDAAASLTLYCAHLHLVGSLSVERRGQHHAKRRQHLHTPSALSCLCKCWCHVKGQGMQTAQLSAAGAQCELAVHAQDPTQAHACRLHACSRKLLPTC